MSEPQDRWQKLARLARQAPPATGSPAPFGFATRVAARWAAGERLAPSAWDLWERFSLRGLALAGALALATLCASYDLATPGWTHEFEVADAGVVDLLTP